MSASLVLFNKNGERKVIPLDQRVSIVGRRPDCDIRVPVLLVSRKHCRFVQDENQTTIQDLGSANGTFVNNERVMETQIKAGDVITVGSVHFTFQVNGQPSEITPPVLRKNDLDTLHDSTGKNLSGISKTQISPAPSGMDSSAEFESLADIDDLADILGSPDSDL